MWKADVWLSLLFKTTEIFLLCLLLQPLFLAGSLPSSCWCSFGSNVTELCLLRSQSFDAVVFCPSAFYRILCILLLSSVFVSLVQTVFCVFLPLHSLHFLGLSFFQFTAGVSSSLVVYYWNLDSEKFLLVKDELMPELSLSNVCLTVLQTIFFVFSFEKTYRHVWTNYKVIAD